MDGARAEDDFAAGADREGGGGAQVGDGDGAALVLDADGARALNDNTKEMLDEKKEEGKRQYMSQCDAH